MKKTIKRISGLSVIFLLLITSCASTLTDVWKSDSYQERTFKKVFVLSALQEPVMIKLFEDEFVSQLASHEIDSVASYTIFQTHGIFEKEGIASEIKAQDADTLLIMRLIKVDKKAIDSIPQKFVIPVWYYDWYQYYIRNAGYIQIPIYNEENYLTIMETALYDTGNEKLIWFARSEILPVRCGCQDLKAFVKVMTDKLWSDRSIKIKAGNH
jgi:hypothetical protein